jgi:hypothetical protein
MGAKKPKVVPSVAVPLTSQNLELNQLGKYHTKCGHGFAAEDANHFIDLLRGRSAQVVGAKNEANGADRLVNGVLIQSNSDRDRNGRPCSRVAKSAHAQVVSDSLQKIG